MAGDEFPSEEEADRRIKARTKAGKIKRRSDLFEPDSVMEQGRQPLSPAQTYVRRTAEDAFLGLPSELWSAYKGITDPVPGMSRWDSIDAYDLQYEGELDRAGTHHPTASDMGTLTSMIFPGGIISGGAKAITKAAAKKAARRHLDKKAIEDLTKQASKKKKDILSSREGLSRDKAILEQKKANAALAEQRNLEGPGVKSKAPPPVYSEKVPVESSILDQRGRPIVTGEKTVAKSIPQVPRAAAAQEAFLRKGTQAGRKGLQSEGNLLAGRGHSIAAEEAILKQIMEDLAAKKAAREGGMKLPFKLPGQAMGEGAADFMSAGAARVDRMLAPPDKLANRLLFDVSRIGQSQASEALLSEDMTDAEKLAALQALVEKQKAEKQ